MKVDDAIETISRFFNDLIGTLIPGIVLAVGLAVMHIGPIHKLRESIPKDDGFIVALLLAVLFAAGHGVLAIYSLAVEKFLPKLRLTKKDVVASLVNKQSYLCFQEIVTDKIKQGSLSQTSGQSGFPWDFHDLRNLALSISSEASSLGRRFMFISLLCNGVGTALLMMLIDYIGCSIFAKDALFSYAFVWPVYVQGLLLLLAAISFFKRGEAFYARAMSTPFAVALSEMALRQDISANPKN